MKKIVYACLFVTATTSIQPATGQGKQRVFRKYNTQTVLSALAAQDTDFQNKLILVENAVSNYHAMGDDHRTLNLPIIFHVVTSEGQTPVSDEQIHKQLDVLNAHFGSYKNEQTNFPNEDARLYASLGTSPGIRFFLPDNAQGGSPIIHHRTARENWGLNNEVQDPARQGYAPIDPTHFVNVYIASLDSSNAGYGLFPLIAPALDGIVIDPDFFGADSKTGSPYDGGKTLVHLMGSYLGLFELWNEREPCRDDMAEDTPLHDLPTISVSTEQNTRHVCFCPGTPTAMYMNFMDNTDDAQLTLFTSAQVARMRAVLLSESLGRAALIRK